jgi:hypothetical protein
LNDRVRLHTTWQRYSQSSCHWIVPIASIVGSMSV